MPAVRDVTPGRLEIREGGWCLALFGLPFFATGIFMTWIFVGVFFAGFGVLPLASVVGRWFRSRVGRTLVTASTQVLCVQERGIFRTRTVAAFPASEMSESTFSVRNSFDGFFLSNQNRQRAGVWHARGIALAIIHAHCKPSGGRHPERGVSMHTRRFLCSLLIAAITSAIAVRAADTNNYSVTILVSNEPGEAPATDSKLVNAWGIATAGASPWWVSDNGSDWSTVYNGAGVKQSREVVVSGAPTGIVGYTGGQFLVGGHPATFMWATENGSILGWNSGLGDPTHAQVVFPHADSVYKGLAIHDNTLYTTDFAECEVETLDGSFQPFTSAGGFVDDSIPDDYCPFGIQAIGNAIFVTYALKGGEDDVAGQGHGFVREFDVNGNLIAAVANHGQLNSPWDLAAAPASFGRFGGCLLVGNFGDGHINAYCLDGEGNYHFQGMLRQDRKPVEIDGLWGIGFGNNGAAGSPNVLYFAAGPDDEMNGDFGKIDFAPETRDFRNVLPRIGGDRMARWSRRSRSSVSRGLSG